MNELIQALKTLLESNQLVGAIASGGVVVWIIANIKSVYYTIRNFIEDVISFTISNLVEDRGYASAEKQIAFDEIVSEAKPIWERSINLNLERTCGKSVSTYGSSVKIIYGKLCLVKRFYSTTASKNNITTDIRVFFAFKKNFMKRLNDDIADRVKRYAETNNDRDTIQVYCGSNDFRSVKSKRSINSLFTNDNVAQKALDDIKKFISNESIYRKLNYPYKYCCCFYGEPGCGKTSTILAIASELNRDICYINMSKMQMDDLTYCLSSMNAKRYVFVFEDIDAVCTESLKDRTDDNEDGSESKIGCDVSLSEFLNVTDGLLSRDGTICIFTTNHLKKLDPALLRSGRMNNLVKFDMMRKDTANKMLKKYLGHEIEGLKNEIRPSDLQEAILNVLVGKMSESELQKKFAA